MHPVFLVALISEINISKFAYCALIKCDLKRFIVLTLIAYCLFLSLYNGFCDAIKSRASMKGAEETGLSNLSTFLLVWESVCGLGWPSSLKGFLYIVVISSLRKANFSSQIMC